MLNKEQIGKLLRNEEYIYFLNVIYQGRENLISQLHDAPLDRLQQIAGRIIEADEILTIGGWNEYKLIQEQGR